MMEKGENPNRFCWKAIARAGGMEYENTKNETQTCQYDRMDINDSWNSSDSAGLLAQADLAYHPCNFRTAGSDSFSFAF